MRLVLIIQNVFWTHVRLWMGEAALFVQPLEIT